MKSFILPLILVSLAVRTMGSFRNMCDEGCVDCHFMTCSKCDREFALYKNECYECPDKCDKCSIIESGGEVMTHCIGSCQVGCEKCNPDFTCAKCSHGYGLHEGTCYACPYKCDKCSVTATSQRVFTVCDGSCQVGCEKCNSDFTCGACSDGYALYQGVCHKCPISQCDKCIIEKHKFVCVGSCHGGCTSCNPDKTCAECKPGYELSRGVCYKCQEGCDHCTLNWINPVQYQSTCTDSASSDSSPQESEMFGAYADFEQSFEIVNEDTLLQDLKSQHYSTLVKSIIVVCLVGMCAMAIVYHQKRKMKLDQEQQNLLHQQQQDLQEQQNQENEKKHQTEFDSGKSIELCKI